jgi:hypothetical protein
MTVDSDDDNYDVLNEIKKIHSFLRVWFYGKVPLLSKFLEAVARPI